MIMNKPRAKKFTLGVKSCSLAERESRLRAAVDRICEEYDMSFPPIVFSRIKDYGYTRMGKDFDKSPQAIHKWFLLSRIPCEHIPRVALLLNVSQSLLKKRLRNNNE